MLAGCRSLLIGVGLGWLQANTVREHDVDIGSRAADHDAYVRLSIDRDPSQQYLADVATPPSSQVSTSRSC